MSWLFALCACMSIVAVALICVFLFANGIPAIKEIGAVQFLFGTDWSPKNQPASYGILPMIIGSLPSLSRAAMIPSSVRISRDIVPLIFSCA